MMLSLLKKILLDECGGLGITRASITSAVADDTGDDGPDAIVKINRLINREGRGFCALGTFPFLNQEINFSITSSAYQYSGTSYLPDTYKRAVGAYIMKSGDTKHYPLSEINVDTFFSEESPEAIKGMPEKFCVQLISSGYYQIIFDRTPDATYTVYITMEKQWVDVTTDATEVVVTKPFYPFLVHYIDMARFSQQGDAENYKIFQDAWDNPMKPHSKLKVMLSMLAGKIKHKAVKVDMANTRPGRISQGNLGDYGQPPNEDSIGYD